MSTVTSATDPSAATAAAQTIARTAQSGSDIQNNFLKLLVTQLQNQDPLNPMDNSQITSQMAQISTVSGIDQLNTTLQAMATNFSADQSLQATSMIGHQVLAAGSTLQLQNGAANAGVSLPQAVDKLVVSVKDGSGQVVHQADLGAQPAGVVAFQWDGTTDSGAKAADGSYTFTVQAAQNGTSVSATTLSAGSVSGVTTGASGVQLKVNGMGSIALSDVKQVM